MDVAVRPLQTRIGVGGRRDLIKQMCSADGFKGGRPESTCTQSADMLLTRKHSRRKSVDFWADTGTTRSKGWL